MGSIGEMLRITTVRATQAVVLFATLWTVFSANWIIVAATIWAFITRVATIAYVPAICAIILSRFEPLNQHLPRHASSNLVAHIYLSWGVVS